MFLLTTGETWPFRLWSRGETCWQSPSCSLVSRLNPSPAAPFCSLSFCNMYNSILLLAPFFNFVLLIQSQIPLFSCPVLKQSKFPLLSHCPDLMAAFLLPLPWMTYIWWDVWKLTMKRESIWHSSNPETWQVSSGPHLCWMHSSNWRVLDFHLWAISAQPLEVMSDCAPLGSIQQKTE